MVTEGHVTEASEGNPVFAAGLSMPQCVGKCKSPVVMMNSIGQGEKRHMPRGIIPRQPARTGRQDKVHVTRTTTAAKSLPKEAARGPAARQKAAVAARKPAAKKPQGKKYNPTAPERVAEVLQRLNHLYPDVTCAITHKSAWELLVATILSAQSTDVNVNRVTPGLFQKYPSVEAFAALDHHVERVIIVGAVGALEFNEILRAKLLFQCRSHKSFSVVGSQESASGVSAQGASSIAPSSRTTH